MMVSSGHKPVLTSSNQSELVRTQAGFDLYSAGIDGSEEGSGTDTVSISTHMV